MEFSRQEYWSELPFPSPGDLPHPGIEPGSPVLQAGSLPFETPGKLNSFECYSQIDCFLPSICIGISFLLRFLMTGYVHQRHACWVSRSWGMSPPHWSTHRGWMVPTVVQSWPRLSASAVHGEPSTSFTMPSHCTRWVFHEHWSAARDKQKF